MRTRLLKKSVCNWLCNSTGLLNRRARAVNRICLTKIIQMVINKNINYFDETQWKLFLERFNIDYKMMINGDDELRSIIYTIFQEDFKKFDYDK